MPVYPLTLTISTRFISPPAQLKSNTLFRSGPSSERLINFILPQPASTFFLRDFSNLLLLSFVSLFCLFLYLLSHSSGVCLDISNSQSSHTKDPHRLQTNIYHFNTKSHGTFGCSPVPVSGIFNRLHQRTVFLWSICFSSLWLHHCCHYLDPSYYHPASIRPRLRNCIRFL